MRLKKVSLKDKKLLDKFLNLISHELSVYTFENIYIWRGLFEIYWTIFRDNLCILFKDKTGCFLYLPPLAKNTDPLVVEKIFNIMDEFNFNKDVSRIENVEENDLSFYCNLGYKFRHKSDDYTCLRKDLIQLKGNKFKSKRACLNYFIKHNCFEYLPYSFKYQDGCLRLYNLWMEQRKDKFKDPVYRGMLEENLNCLGILLDDYRGLDLLGRIVRIDNAVKAFSFGFRLNKDTFCISHEIADLSIKGIAQFIFWKFCFESEDYKYVNIMDDSGLENLKRVKLSYHPKKIIPAHIITKQ